MRRGLYRVHGVGGRSDDVRVEDDGIDIPMEEQLYRMRGYLPPVDDLPWQDDYLSKKPSASSGTAVGDATDKAAREQARQEFRARFRSP
jgi:hypothetical protein